MPKSLLYLGNKVAAAAPSCFADLLASYSPSAWWRMGEPYGSTVADQIGSNDITLVNSPTMHVAGLLSGDTNTAIRFVEASTQYGTVPDATALDLGDVFTIGFLVSLDTNGITHIVNKGSTGGTGYAVWIDSSNNVKLSESAFTNSIIFSATALSTATEYFVVITKNGSTRALYLNGVDDTDLGGTTNATLTNTTSQLVVGAPSAGGSNPLDGVLDELFFIAGTALTAGQVAALEAARVVSCGFDPDAYDTVILNDVPAAYWPFYEASGSPEDVSGNANHVVTVNGTPVYQQSGLPFGGYSIDLDEDVDAYFFVADSATIPDTGALSYEAWISRKSDGGWDSIFRKGSSGSSPYLFVDNDNLVYWRAGFSGGAKSSVTIGARDLADLDFYHIVGTRDGSNNWKVYVNGDNVTVVIGTTATASNTDQLVIGAINDASGEAEMFLAKPAMYPYELTPAQVKDHYQAGKAIFTRHWAILQSGAVHRAGSW